MQKKKSPSRLLITSGTASRVHFFLPIPSFSSRCGRKFYCPSLKIMGASPNGVKNVWSTYTFCRRPGMFQTCTHNFPFLRLDSGKACQFVARQNRNFKRAADLDKFGFPNNPGNQKYKYAPKKTEKLRNLQGLSAQ